LDVFADGNRHKSFNAEKHSSTALSPLPHGKDLPSFHLQGFPEDAGTVRRLRPQV
jgi:hypothetical protein